MARTNISGVTYFKLAKRYDGDVTKDCGLTGAEIDANFHFLRGRDVKNIRISEDGKLIITFLDGSNISVPNFKDYIVETIEETVKEPTLSGSTYDSEDGVLTLLLNGVEYEVGGFFTKDDIGVYVSKGINGDGSACDPLRVSLVEETGVFAPVDEIVQGPIESGIYSKEKRYLTIESITKQGYLYNFHGLQLVAETLERENSEWRIATFNDWAGALNGMEDCGIKNHENTESGLYGEDAGYCAKDDAWNEDILGDNSLCILPSLSGTTYENVSLWSYENDENTYVSKSFIKGEGRVATVELDADGFYPIRLVKDVICDGDGESIITINGVPYETVQLKHELNGKTETKLWLKTNLSLAVNDPSSYKNESDNEDAYFINEFDSVLGKWVKKEFKPGYVVYDKSQGEDIINDDGVLKIKWDKYFAIVKEYVDNEVSTEKAERIEADEHIIALLSAEAQERKDEDESIREALSAETDTRKEEDAEIRQALSAETEERKDSDSTILSALTEEIHTREEENAEIRQSLSAETQERKDEDESIREALSAETQERIDFENEAASAITENAENIAKEREERIEEDENIRNETDARFSMIEDILSGITSGFSGDIEALSAYTFEIGGNLDELSGTVETIKDKVDGIESGAQVNIIEKITVNGEELPITDKTVDIPKGELKINEEDGSTDYLEISGLTLSFKPGLLASKEDLSAATEEIKSNISEISGQISDINEKLSGLSENITELSSITANVSEDVKNISGATSALSESITELSSSTEEIKSDVDAISGATSALSENITELSAVTSGLSESIAELSAVTSGLSEDIKDISAITSALSENVAELSGATEELKSDVNEISGTTIELSDSIDSLSGKTAELIGNISEISGITSGISESVSELSAATSDILNDVGDIKSDLSAETEERKSEISRLDELIEEISSGSTEFIEKLNEEISARTESDDILSKEIDNLSTFVTDALTGITELIDSINDDIDELAEAVSGNTSDISTLSGETVAIWEELAKKDDGVLTDDIIFTGKTGEIILIPSGTPITSAITIVAENAGGGEGGDGKVKDILVNGKSILNDETGIAELNIDHNEDIAITQSGGTLMIDVLGISNGEIVLRDANGHDYVDLGLPSGTLWATMNVGATAPEEYGGYYAWGETATKENYDWSTYAYGDGETFMKYNEADGKLTLEPQDDVARVNWGGDWRIPTREQIEEFNAGTTKLWTQVNGVSGLMFTSKTNGNSIFIPAGGALFDGSHWKLGTGCYIWSSSLNTLGAYSNASRLLGEGENNINISTKPRYDGFNIRGIIK